MKEKEENECEGDVNLMTKKPKDETLISIQCIESNKITSAPRSNRQEQPQVLYVRDESGRVVAYYQQQSGGQPIYVQGVPPPPIDLQNTPRYQTHLDDDSFEHVNINREIFTNSFNSIQIRHNFIKRVYTILAVQLLVTFGFVLLCTYIHDLKWFMVTNSWLMYLSMAVFFVLYICLVCYESLTRTHPLNFILLGILTISLSVMTGMLAAIYRSNIVLASIGITAIICIVITIFAMQTKYDITNCGACLCIITSVVVIYGFIVLILSFFMNVRILHLVYVGLAAGLFCLYLLYDTQLICGGRKYSLSPEEYVSGALHLYIDIILIFWQILILMGGTRN